MDSFNININPETHDIKITQGQPINISVSEEVVQINQCKENYTLNLEGTVVSIDANYDHNVLYNRDASNQHPISAITGLQEALQRADTYIHEQGVASSEWVINHNLNKFPSVTVVDSADNEIIVSVRYVDANTCVIDLTSPFKGKAYLN